MDPGAIASRGASAGCLPVARSELEHSKLRPWRNVVNFYIRARGIVRLTSIPLKSKRTARLALNSLLICRIRRRAIGKTSGSVTSLFLVQFRVRLVEA
jgi:hypothetical protein